MSFGAQKNGSMGTDQLFKPRRSLTDVSMHNYARVESEYTVNSFTACARSRQLGSAVSDITLSENLSGLFLTSFMERCETEGFLKIKSAN